MSDSESNHSDDNPLLTLLEDAGQGDDKDDSTSSQDSSDSDLSVDEEEDEEPKKEEQRGPKDYSFLDNSSVLISQLENVSSDTVHAILKSRKTLRETGRRLYQYRKRDLWPCPLSNGVVPGPPRPLAHVPPSRSIEDFDDSKGSVKVRSEPLCFDQDDRNDIDPSGPLRIEIERAILQEERTDQDVSIEEKTDDAVNMIKDVLGKLAGYRTWEPINLKMNRMAPLTKHDVMKAAKDLGLPEL
jgi:hypothetical protein